MFLKLEDMTIEQKIGMVLCVRRYEDEDMDFIFELIKKRALGCAQGSMRNIDKVNQMMEAADYPIILVDDMERGFVGTQLPKIPMNVLSACNKPEYCHAFAKGVVRDAKNNGYNGNWGPVIDVLECNGPCKVSRTFSDTTERISKLSAEILKIYDQNHFFGCGKHFPGSSGSPFDNHMGETPSYYTEEQVIEKNLAPYKYLLEQNLLHTVMVGHTIFEKIDPDYPSSLSKKIIKMLRDIGFDGVLFCDSFAMISILQKYGEENIYGMAMDAGIDIILPNYRTSVKDCYNMLMQNFKDGLFTEERLDEAVRRVLALQEFVGTKPENPTEFTAEDEKLLNDVAKDCITAVTDAGVSAALPETEGKRLFVIIKPNQSEKDADIPEIGIGGWYHPEIIEERIKEDFPDADILSIPEFSSWLDHERLLSKSTQYKDVVVVSYCATTAYLGTDGLTRRSEAWINALQRSNKISAIVHFGNPLALETIGHIPRRIFGYEMEKSHAYAIDVLAGKIEAKGTLPFDVKLQ